jgi:esterase
MLLKSKIIGNGSEALIILHGFLGMSDNWNSYAKKINDKGFQIHLLDQRNHGKSFHSEEFNYETLSNDLKYYIDYHQIKNFSLIGHSLGGKTAMMFASTYPNTVKKLIVVDILPIYYKNDYENILKSLKSLDFKSISSRLDADKALSIFIQNQSFRSFLLKNLKRVSKDKLTFKIDLDIISDNLSEVEKALPSDLYFPGETLFIKGQKSDYIDNQKFKITYNNFPKSRLVEVSNAGHWVHAENLNDFAKETLYFLKS